MERYADGVGLRVLSQEFRIGTSTARSRLHDAGVALRYSSGWVGKTIGIDQQHTETFVEIIDGLMLGDGSISKTGVLNIGQSHVRVGWLQDIQRDLAGMGFHGTLNTLNRPERIRKDGKVFPPYIGFALWFPTCSEIKMQRARWYPNGVKVVPEDVRITPISTAHWISGDGTGGSSGQMILCTDSFSMPETIGLMQRLKDAFGVHPVLRGTRIGILKKDDVVTIRDKVISHMSDCCHYKFRFAQAAQKKGKLSPDEVRGIRHQHNGGVSLAKIANAHRLNKSTVHDIVRRATYTWVP